MIEGINFFELEAEKIWQFAAGYKGDIKAETRSMIFSGQYSGAIKKDGHYFRFVKDDGRMTLQGRSESVNGGFLNKIGHVPHLQSFFDLLPNGTCLLGELYFPDNPGSKNVTTIMGCKEAKAIERQEKGPKLFYYIFDIWAYNGKSFLEEYAENRFDYLSNGPISEILEQYENKYIEIAKYVEGEELWNLLVTAKEADEEGIVMTKLGSKPEPGKRTARKTLKVKKELDNKLDVFFTGNYKNSNRLYTGKYVETWRYWEDLKTLQKLEGNYYDEYNAGKPIEPITKTYFEGWAGSIEIGAYDEGTDTIKAVGFISGVSDEIKQEIVENNEAYRLRPCLVTAMEIDTESKKLRHGKFIEFRDDINWKSCEIGKIWNN